MLQCKKENRIDSAIVSVSVPTEANWNLLICPKCENEYESEEDLRSHIEVAHNGLEESFPSLCSEINFSKITFNCSQCDKVLENKVDLEAHL